MISILSSLAINTLLFEIIFGNSYLILKLLLSEILIGCSVVFLLYLKTATLVSSEANKSYELLNKLFMSSNKWTLSLSKGIKVYNRSEIYFK